MWRKLFIWLISGWMLVSGVGASEASATEKVEKFTANYQINQDTSLEVVEEIDYSTTTSKHGIFRYIPLKYDKRSEIKVRWQKVEIWEKIWVSHPYTTSEENGKSLAKIGDSDETFSGERIYRLEYEVKNALERYENWDEFYWDIVGEDWDFPISSIAAMVKSEYAAILEVDCWSGGFGGDDGWCEAAKIDEQTVEVRYAGTIRQGQNVTVGVKLDKNNALVFPSWWEVNGESVVMAIIVAAIGLGLLAVVVVVIYKSREEIFVDDMQLTLEPSGATRKKPLFYQTKKAFWYEPFPNLVPAEVGMIYERNLTVAGVVAEIVNLMAKGYLKIEFGEKKWGKQDYIFTNKITGENDLVGIEKDIYNVIFKSGEVVKLSELKHKFNLGTLAMGLEKDLERAGMAEKKMGSGSVGTMVVAALIAMVVAPYLIPIGVVILMATGGLGRVRLTARGNHYRYLINGLKSNLRLGKWRTEIQEKILYVENILPLAIALGEADKLAKDMKELGLDKIDEGVESGGGMASAEAARLMSMHAILSSGIWHDFNRDFTHNFNSTYAHQTSGGGGSGFGGGGFSGGGSSGGGGGGGGGGSW